MNILPLRTVILVLCAAGAASCTKREEPTTPPSPAVTHPAPSAAKLTPASAAPSPAVSAPEASSPSGADLEKVARDAAAFEDMVDSLRKFAGKDVELNAVTLDLDAFVQGKSERNLFKFAQAARDQSPYAAMQVLEYLWRQDLDVEFRIKIASLFGDLVTQCGYEKDRALARECVDWLVGICADPAQAAAMSARERDNLICILDRLAVNLDGYVNATEKRIADAIRKSAQSDLERSWADEFDAFALMRTGNSQHIPAIRSFFESIRARDVYGTTFALRSRVDHWRSLDDATFAADIKEAAEFMAQIHARAERQRQGLESLSPAERLAEMRLRHEASAANRQPSEPPATP